MDLAVVSGPRLIGHEFWLESVLELAGLQIRAVKSVDGFRRQVIEVFGWRWSLFHGGIGIKKRVRKKAHKLSPLQRSRGIWRRSAAQG
jgi:hypothetical protein